MSESEKHTATEGSGPRAWRVVVLDTDAGVRWSLEKGLSRSGYDVRTATTTSEVLRYIHEEDIDAIVMELLPEAGLTLESISALTNVEHAPEIICVSIDSTPRTVVECLRRGVADYLVKPFSLAEVRGALAKILKRNEEMLAEEGSGGDGKTKKSLTSLIGVSPAIQDLRTVIHQAAKTDLNCLIRGPSGVGKDLVAREIHRLSQRNDKPFVKVNCTALPENLLESELFGYEKGAFTGAETSKPGRFSLANGGIIFLDEIGDMHPHLQAKILQVIEHKEFTKLGGGNSVKVDVQIVAATNADLEAKIAAGTFRDDLYFRLNEVYIWVPSLAERKEDVPLLVRHFLRKHSQYGGAKVTEISSADLERLIEYEWPGNVRELESTVKRWLALGRASVQSMTQGPSVNLRTFGSGPAAHSTAGQAGEMPKTNRLAPERILEVLEEHQWNRRKAAEALGISYASLRRSIDKYQLARPR